MIILLYAASGGRRAAGGGRAETDTKSKRRKLMVFIVKTEQNAAIFRIFDVLRFFWRLCENDEKEAENTKKALKIGEKIAPEL